MDVFILQNKVVYITIQFSYCVADAQVLSYNTKNIHDALIF